jgi:hypothetical protein
MRQKVGQMDGSSCQSINQTNHSSRRTWACALLLLILALPIHAQTMPGAAAQFHADTIALDWTNAYLAMWASRVASDSPAAVARLLGPEGWGFTTVVSVDNSSTDTQGFVAIDDRMILISFRSTEAKYRDWLTDLDFFPKSEDMARVHGGFKTALDSVWPALTKIIGDNVLAPDGQPKPVILTGYSLGGALATIAAVRVRKMMPRTGFVTVYTFGSPRVGNQAFADYAAALGVAPHRFVYGDDIVPYVPFYVPRVALFAPVGSQLRLGPRGLATSQAMPYTIRLYGLQYARAVLSSHGQGFDLPVKDHKADHYLRALAQLVPPDIRDKLPRAP